MLHCFALGNYSAFLPATPNIFLSCCPQCGKMFHSVAYNANNFFALQTTTLKTALISIHVCFSTLLPTTPKLFCVEAHSDEKNLYALLPTLQKMVGIVGNNAEKWLYFNLEKFTTTCEFTLGFQSGAQGDEFNGEKLR